MTNTEKEIQKNLYVDMENTFWPKISSDVFWYFLEYWSDPTFTPTVLASIFSDMMKNNAFKLAGKIENEVIIKKIFMKKSNKTLDKQ